MVMEVEARVEEAVAMKYWVVNHGGNNGNGWRGRSGRGGSDEIVGGEP